MKKLLLPIVAAAVFGGVCYGISECHPSKEVRLPGQVTRTPGPGGADVLVLKNRHAELEVALYGAQIRRYEPVDQAPVLFAPTVPLAYEKGGTVFGGIPYCWPWFNMNGEAQTGQHGFSRTSVWRLAEATSSEDVTEVKLVLESTEETKKAWPYDFRLTYNIRLSDRLELDFSTENTGSAAFDVTEGFHPYFNVADVTNTVLKGFDGVRRDMIDPDKPNPVQHGDLPCVEAHNAVYFPTPGPVEIVDPGNKRSIFLWARENRKVILWNPGRWSGIPEFGKDDWRHIMCVEPANIQRECKTHFLPGKTHELRMTVQSVPVK